MENSSSNRWAGLRDWVAAIVLLEGASISIGLLMPITPSKTGAKIAWSPASLIKQDPTYVESAIAWFFLTNFAITFLGLIVFFAVKRRRA